MIPWLLSTTKTTLAPVRTAVSTSMPLKPKAASPLTLITGTSGRASLAPIAQPLRPLLGRRQQLPHHLSGIAGDAQLHRPLQPDLGRLDIDLDQLRFRREAAAVAEDPVQPCAEDQHDVGTLHRQAAGGAH